jgi:hypothetical protein
MKMNATQIERTLNQFKAEAIPDDHPIVRELSALFGDHTFFLDPNGLSVVEPNESVQASAQSGTVVNLANWSDAHLTSLAPHEPERTEIVVIFETQH